METEFVNSTPCKQQLRYLKFLATRISYYSNSSASFQIDILIYGDINPNPGPPNKNNTETTNFHHVKKVYERSELLLLQPTSPALPLSVQSYINSLEIPTKKNRMTHRGHRRRHHQSHGSSVSTNQGTNPLTNQLLPAKTSLGSSNFALWNARSIKLKVPILFDLVISNKIDILAITESWLTGDHRQDHVLAELSLTFPNYNVHHIPRGNKRSGGGVLVLLRKSYNATMSTITSFKSFEYMDITITSRSHMPVRLYVLYRPQKFQNKKDTAPIFFHEFSSFLENISTVSGHLLITGDFNFHVNKSTDREASRFTDIIDSADLQQHVDKPTHKSGNTLDLILTRSDFVTNITTTHYLPSDHAAVLCLLNIPRPEPKRMEISIRKFRDIDIDAFRNDILNSTLYTSSFSDLDMLVAEYDHVLTSLKDKHAPLITRTIRGRPNAPWYNENLRNMKRELRRLERRWLSSKLEIDRQRFKDFSYQYNDQIKQAKLEYHKMQFENCNSKQLFQKVEKLSKPKSSKVLPSEISEVSLADRFSTFFAEKIEHIKDNLKNSQHSETINTCENSSTTTFSSLATLSEDSVREIIMKSPSTSCNLDPIPTWLLKKCADEIVPIITQIINMSFQNGHLR